ncbi:MAG: M20/M25/M40 family metallo-hydrolase [Candidatus Latescibacteria bacterium]|nr:M20/M25/M40 family metallo-hydrolase [Candidatus Latescibacterota bacterium]
MIDWQAVRQEVTQHLQALVRLDTTNPPGNEIIAARYLAGVLEGEGLTSCITESAPGRANITTRLVGGDEPPLLLLGHTDVVAVEPEQWTHPPFSGALIDDRVWGRGALDMKNMVAAELMVLLLFKRLGLRPNRDLLFAATADEEAGKGDHGPGWLLDNHPEQLEAPLILTEGAGADIEIGGQRYYTCQTGQKGLCRLRLIGRGRPGHGSMPHDENAILQLARSLAGLQGVRLPLHPSATVAACIEGIAGRQDGETGRRLRALLDPEAGDGVWDGLPVEDTFKDDLQAVLRNTASVTMLQSGSKINVIPAAATAWIDGRLAPGQSADDFVAELRPYIDDAVDIEIDQYSPPLEGRVDTPLYRTIEEVMDQLEPGVPVLPVISNGGTDAKHILPRRPDTLIYGFMPYRQAPGEEEMRLIHGHDERTSVDNLLFATRALFEIVCRFCGVKNK